MSGLAVGLFVFNSLCVADGVQTTYGITSGVAHEAFMPTQNVVIVDTSVAAQAVTMTYAVTKLKKDHPKLAWVILVGGIAARGYAVSHNFRELR